MTNIVSDTEPMIAGNARECKHFIRVNEKDGLSNITNRRGFCTLGCLEGDFTLCVSTSQCHACPAFIISDYNAETTRMEKELSEGFNEITRQLYDRRTAIHKELSKFSTRYRELMGFKKDMFFHLEQRTIAHQYYVEANKDKYHEVANRHNMRSIDYQRIIHYVLKNIDDFVQKAKYSDYGVLEVENKKVKK